MGDITDLKVKTSIFEGPLELLLNLIEKRKLVINDVSLSKVADDFIEKISRMGDFPIAEGAHFILIASTLLLIKSKSLLPILDLTGEEQSDIEELERRLKMYKIIKDNLQNVKDIFGNSPLFMLEERPIEPIFTSDKTINLNNLRGAIFSVLNALPKSEKKIPKTTIKKVISLEEMINNLAGRITKSLKMSFREYSGFGKAEKLNVIVSFLAMLELVKRGAIKASQENHFEDITIETESIGTPRY